VAAPIFIGGAYLFEAVNSNHLGVPTSDDQDFYVFGIHGSLSHVENIGVYYNASFPWPIPAGRSAITWGKDIYVKTYGSESRDRMSVNFEYITRLMLYELTHVKQFKSLGYITPAFGREILISALHSELSCPKLSIPLQKKEKASAA
jgi:hypothetical protein